MAKNMKISDAILKQLSRRLNERQQLALVLGLIAAVYLPLIAQPFGWTDDFVFLNFIECHQTHYLHFLDIIGRPLQTPIFIFGLSLVANSDSGWELGFIGLRLVALIGLLVVAFQLTRFMRSLGDETTKIIGVTLLLLTTPALFVTTLWITLFVVNLGMIFALGAGIFALKNQRFTPFISSVLLIMALCIYQPAAMTFWLPLAIQISTPNRPQISRFLWLKIAILFALSLLIYYVGQRLFAAPLFAEPLMSEIAHRGQPLSLDAIPEKLAWFFRYPLPISLTPFTVSPHHSIALVTAVLSGYLIYRTGHYLTALLILSGVYLPILAIAENPESLRVLIAPTLVWTVFAIGGLHWLLVDLKLAHAFPLALFGIAIFSAATNGLRVHDDWIQLTQQDLRATARRLPDSPPPTIHLQLAPFQNRHPHQSPFIEYGVTSSRTPYAAPYLVKRIYTDRGFNACPLVFCTTACDSELPTVNLSDLSY